MYKYELEIDVFRCLKALLKNVKFIIVFSFFFFIAGVGTNINLDSDTYGATATVYAGAGNSYSETSSAVTAMNAYVNIAKSYKVCQKAAQLLGRSDVRTEDIMRAIHISSSADSATSKSASSVGSIISFTATTTEPELSKEIADAMAQTYVSEMSNILHSDSVKILDSAYKTFKSHNAIRSAIEEVIGFTVVGFALACLIVVAFEIFDLKVRTLRDATAGENIPILGVIPDYKE